MDELPEKPTALGELLSISTPYASQLLSGNRPWPRTLAITAYRKTGVKVGPIVGATDDEITVLERFDARPGAQGQAA